MGKVLCVAEKPSIAKAVATHLNAGRNANSVRGLPWLYNYEFQYRFANAWGDCNVVFTSVAGHLNCQDFDASFRYWRSCDPIKLFGAPIETSVEKGKEIIAENIKKHARGAQALFIWTDCDREGEHIGTEIRDVALKINPRLDVKRARFSNIERAHVINAARNPIPLDDKQAQAVAARMELDLRIGAAFTRLQTLNLQDMIKPVQEDVGVISYGSCQFPTLGFVVDRYLRVKNFKPEPFWYIKVTHEKDDIKVDFNWKRVHLFDRVAVTIIFERCLNSKLAKVTMMLRKPTSKWRPLPLTTVELQKMGSKYLRMDSQRVMTIAEKLYTSGWISYPRTETDQFDKGMDLRKLVEKQQPSTNWGAYAAGLMNGGFRQPRSGRNNDQAHPPIHPVNFVAPSALADDEERRVYEFVVRRFLACCSEDAKGEGTDVEIDWGGEAFRTHGLIVLQRNYLDVYPYDKWESSQQLPQFTMGETFEPKEAKMLDGKTSAPGYLTEPELIALMEANGIGTDATMAEHIAKIKERKYVFTRARGRQTAASGGDQDDADGPVSARGRGGRGRGRGGRTTNGTARGGQPTTGMQEFIPSTLGIALVEGYDKIGFEASLSKPFLRKEVSEKGSRSWSADYELGG